MQRPQRTILVELLRHQVIREHAYRVGVSHPQCLPVRPQSPRTVVGSGQRIQIAKLPPGPRRRVAAQPHHIRRTTLTIRRHHRNCHLHNPIRTHRYLMSLCICVRVFRSDCHCRRLVRSRSRHRHRRHPLSHQTLIHHPCRVELAHINTRNTQRSQRRITRQHCMH